MEFHIDADVLGQPSGEQFGLLARRQPACMHSPCLERLHIRINCGGEGKARQVGEMIGAEGRTEPLLTECAEVILDWAPSIRLEHQVPLLGDAGEVVRREPDPVLMACLMAIEELLAFVQPAERILFAVVCREHELVVLGNHVTLLCPFHRQRNRHPRRCRHRRSRRHWHAPHDGLEGGDRRG